jgi:hypothetical protein
MGGREGEEKKGGSLMGVWVCVCVGARPLIQLSRRVCEFL